MTSLLRTLAELSLSVGAVICVLAALSARLDRRFVAKWKYWVWLALAVRLMIPFNLHFNTITLNVPTPESELTLPQYIQQGRRTEAPLDEGLPPVAARPPIETIVTTGGALTLELPVDRDLRSYMTLDTLLAALYLLGVALFAGVLTAKYRADRKRLLRWSYPAKETQLLSVYRQACDELDLQDPAQLRCTKGADSPMVIGILKPTLLLPVRSYSDQELYFVLRHELVHLKRRDLHYKLVLLVANALHWFNPAVYLMVREAGKNLEFACDDEVVRGLPSEQRRCYSETILSVVSQGATARIALSTQYSDGADTLKARFQNILRPGNKRRGRAAALLVALFAGTLCGLVACGPVAENTVDLTDLEVLHTRYLAPAAAVAVTASSWDNPGEIAPDSLAKFFFYTEAGAPYLEAAAMDIPADLLEAEVMNHFAVAAEHLRTSTHYDTGDHIYRFGSIGGKLETAVTGAATENGVLELDYVHYSPTDNTITTLRGTLVLDLSQGGFSYRSCHTETPPNTSDLFDINMVAEQLWGAHIGNVSISSDNMENDVVNPREQGIRVTHELLADLAHILADSPVERTHEVIDLDYFEDPSLYFNLTDNYLSSRPYSYFEISLVGEGAHSGKTLLTLASSDDAESPSYLYSGHIFHNIATALSEAAYTYPNTIRGHYTVAFDTSDEQFYSYVLQVQDTLLFVAGDYRYGGSMNTVIETIDAATGDTLHQATVDGRPLRIEVTDYEDFDYRIYMPSSIVYKNSLNTDIELRIDLPATVIENLDLDYLNTVCYDIDVASDLIVWRAEDGIYRSDLQGRNAKRILHNTQLPTLLGEPLKAQNLDGLPYDVAGLRYIEPIIMNGGRTIVASMNMRNYGYNAKECGISIMDARTADVEHLTGLETWYNGSATRVDDRTLMVQRDSGYYFIDVRTTDMRFIDFDNDVHYAAASHDYRTFFEVVTGRADTGELVQALVSFQREDPDAQQVHMLVESHQLHILAVTPDYVACRYLSNEDRGVVILPQQSLLIT